MRRATGRPRRPSGTRPYFYPRPPCGGRPAVTRCAAGKAADFYPRPPCGGRHCPRTAPIHPGDAFLSTPSVWRATFVVNVSVNSRRNFYPRPPCGGRPSRMCSEPTCEAYFYPRPPCGGRHGIAQDGVGRNCISIHALRVEGDAGLGSPVPARWVFLSTLSSRRATSTRPHLFLFPIISIHALLAESDRSPGHHRQSTHNFYPRSPRGERRGTNPRKRRPAAFLSTLSSRRATPGRFRRWAHSHISIHALLAESDRR